MRTLAILGSFGNVTGFTDDPNFGKEDGARVVPNLNLVNMPIRIEAIAYPLALMTCVHPGRAPHTFQENVTKFECVRVPPHYFEAVHGRSLPTFELWQAGQLQVSWLTTLVTTPTPPPTTPPARKPGLIRRLLIALAGRIPS